MSYGHSKKVKISYDEAIIKIKESLKKEGFGVITEIDVRDNLKQKLNVDYENYIILGACNPSLAYKALQCEKEIGLLLPCNVIVYSTNGETVISLINPIEAMKVVDNPKLKDIAILVDKKLKKVMRGL